jgi:hypothetical protein
LLASAELFDPETGTFTVTGDMTTGRGAHTATLLADGRVLIAGGPTADLYDPSTGTFTATGNMVAAQYVHTATLLNSGKVLIFRLCADWGYPTTKAELYDPIAATFSVVGDPPDPERIRLYGLCGPATLVATGKVLIGDELYDPATNTFSLTGQRTNTLGLYGTTATLLTNGKVLLTGGSDDYGYHANAEFYEPSTGKFNVAGKMIRARANHTSTLLLDGTVLLTGNLTYPGDFTASAELYDPATGTFTATADTTSPRFLHTATLLMDGRILMAGGYTSWPFFAGGEPSYSAELYVPSVLVPAPVVTDLQLDRTNAVVGTSYSVNVSGSNLTPQTFLDVRFTSPGSKESDVVLNWQRGVAASHGVPAGTASGIWTITGVRAHQIETDHTGNFVPVSGPITVFPICEACLSK